MKRVLLIDPSARGGIAAHSDYTARALAEAGVRSELLASRLLADSGEPYPVWRWLPVTDWARGRSDRAAATAPTAVACRYARRFFEWMHAAAASELAVRARRPSLVDFQAPLNPRLDERLIARLSRRLPVVWTAHDARPLDDDGGGEAARLAGIYRSADLVIAHGGQAADRIEENSGVRPAVLGLLGPRGLQRTERGEARRRLGLTESGRIVGALGFIRAYKGYELLADTWVRLGDRAPLLLVMGELVDERERVFLERLRATGRAEVRLGFASDEDLRLAYCAVDAVALPHERASDSGLLDMARDLATPVIASNAPALAHAIEDGKGLVLPRDPQAWADAAIGELPPPPAPHDADHRPGEARRAVYEEAIEAWRRRRGSAAAAGGSVRRVVAYTDATETGGAELGMATLLAGLSDRHDVTVMAVDEGVGRWIAGRRPGARLEVVPPVRGKWDLPPVIAHARAVRRLQPDVFHANLRIPWADQYGLAAALWVRAGAVIAVEQLITPSSSALQRRLKLLTSIFLDAHVAVGERLAREIEDEVGLPRGAIESIHNSVPESDTAPRDRLGDGPVIGTVSRLAPEKRLDLLVRAVARLPDVTAVIVGGGREEAGLRSLAEECGVADRIVMAGWTDDPLPWLTALDVFVLPSDYEGLPHAIIEAMLAGVPVVATDAGSVREVVADGRTGSVVPRGDLDAIVAAIEALLDDPGRAAELGAAGRERAREEFGTARMVAAYERVYDQVTS